MTGYAMDVEKFERGDLIFDQNREQFYYAYRKGDDVIAIQWNEDTKELKYFVFDKAGYWPDSKNFTDQYSRLFRFSPFNFQEEAEQFNSDYFGEWIKYWGYAYLESYLFSINQHPGEFKLESAKLIKPVIVESIVINTSLNYSGYGLVVSFEWSVANDEKLKKCNVFVPIYLNQEANLKDKFEVGKYIFEVKDLAELKKPSIDLEKDGLNRNEVFRAVLAIWK
jgi:hypothetical protein